MSEAPTPTSAALPAIAGYRLQRRLGQGGMADVYLAEQASLNRQVAVKVLGNRPNQSSDLSVRFEREARTIARLEHPDIVGIYDVGRTGDGLLYYAMPYLPNGDLSLRDLRGRPQELLAVLRRVCHALEYAHAQGVVHRDVKPENILFDSSDNARLTDFGIAISSEHDQRVTAEGRTLGSSGYMSPEQARGMRLDGRADLYSLGVVLYELLTGDVPYHGSDALSVALAHTQDPVPRLTHALAHWQPVIDQALAKQPAQRFQTAREMLRAIEDAAQSEKTVNTRDMAVAAGEPDAERSPMRLALAAAFLLGALGWLTWVLVSRMPDGKPPDFFVASTMPDARGPVDTLVVNGDALPDAERERLVAESLGLIQQGRLFEPEAVNAAARLRTLAVDAPGDAAVLDTLEQFLAALGTRITAKLKAAEWGAVAADFELADAFVEETHSQASSTWKKVDGDLTASVRTRLETALAEEDKSALPAIKPLVDALSARHGDVKSLFDQVGALPEPGEAMRDTGGPALVYVPARVGASSVKRGFAMMRDEVTVGEFDAFVLATSRRPSACREQGGFRWILTRPTWRKPGFEQDSRHPVVCVSYNDAVAFANWLSSRVHARYRLPTSSEWTHAAATLQVPASICKAGNVLDAGSRSKSVTSGGGLTAHDCSDGARFTAPVGAFAPTSIGLRDIAGNVSEWTSNCADTGSQCGRYVAFGRSFRSGVDEASVTMPTVQSGASGSPSLGFRLVREVGVR